MWAPLQAVVFGSYQSILGFKNHKLKQELHFTEIFRNRGIQETIKTVTRELEIYTLFVVYLATSVTDLRLLTHFQKELAQGITKSRHITPSIPSRKLIGFINTVVLQAILA